MCANMTTGEIRKKITTDRRWCERAILALYEKQTAGEKIAGATCVNNGIGFNGPDGNRMSYYARWIISGKHLTGEFLKDAFDRIGKYAKQLTAIAANKRAATKNNGGSVMISDQTAMKEKGFESKDEFYSLIMAVNLSEPTSSVRFKHWQDFDGTKGGLLQIISGIYEDYVETREGWIYRIYLDGIELTNSLNVPPFTQKEDAEGSATQWQIQAGLI